MHVWLLRLAYVRCDAKHGAASTSRLRASRLSLGAMDALQPRRKAVFAALLVAIVDCCTAVVCYAAAHEPQSLASLLRTWSRELPHAEHGSDLVLLLTLRTSANGACRARATTREVQYGGWVCTHRLPTPVPFLLSDAPHFCAALAPWAFPRSPKRSVEYATAVEELQHVWSDMRETVSRDAVGVLVFALAVSPAFYTLLVFGKACEGAASHRVPSEATRLWLALFQAVVGSVATLAVVVHCHGVARRQRDSRWRPAPAGGLHEPLLNDEEEQGLSNDMPALRRRGATTLRRLLLLSRPDAGKMVVAFTCLILAVICDVAIPSFKADALSAILSHHISMVTGVSNNGGLDAFGRAVLSLAFASLGAGAFAGARGGLLSVCNARLVARLQSSLFGTLIRRDMAAADGLPVGKALSRLTTDTSLVADVLGLNVNVALRSILRLLLTTLYLATLSVPLTLLAVATALLFFAATAVFSQYQRIAAKATQEATADSSGCAEQSLSLLRTVRAFHAEHHEEGRFQGALQRRLEVQERLARVYSGYTVTQTLLDNAQAVLLLTLGGSLYGSGAVSGPVLSKFIFYTGVMSSSIQSTADMIGDTFRAIGASEEVFNLLEAPLTADAVDEARDVMAPPAGCSHAVCRPACGTGITQVSGASVEFSNVSFSYPGRCTSPVLIDVSFNVPPGARLALVGGSGSGKSTCISLLLRFYRPSAGTITVNGHDIGAASARWVRSLTAVVGQEPPLFNGSIRDNIAYACACTDEEVVAAAQLACATSFVSALPEGYNTLVGPKGVQLSGGQKQRVAIARAMARNPRLLLLDEATSALDAASEADVQAALDNACVGRTVLVVAHRLSTVRGCNTIVVMRHGCVVESGNHAELLARKGAYHELVIQQLAAGRSDVEVLTTTEEEEEEELDIRRSIDEPHPGTEAEIETTAHSVL